VLRTAIGIGVAARSALLFSPTENGTNTGVAAALAGLIAGGLLVIGFLTIVASTATGLLCASAFLPHPLSTYCLDSGGAAFVGVAVAGALALLGPGAFSADARLFGPREIIIDAAKKTGLEAFDR
jgi:uncharacterized membrane protein YphA (DoxX/SURF4 family)